MKPQHYVTMFELLFWLIIRIIIYFIVCCLGCIVVSVFLVAFYGEKIGIFEINYLIQKNNYYILNNMGPRYIYLLKHSMMSVFRILKKIDVHVLLINIHHQDNFLNQFSPYANAIILGIKLLATRLYLLIHWCFLFIILGVFGLIDGLSARYIRRISVGRESSMIYHHSKSVVTLSLILGLFVELILPISASDDEWLLVIISIIFSLSIKASAKYFKKYF